MDDQLRLQKLKRWRLVLGHAADEKLGSLAAGSRLLKEEDALMDEALAAIYDQSADDSGQDSVSGRRSAGLGSSAPPQPSPRRHSFNL